MTDTYGSRGTPHQLHRRDLQLWGPAPPAGTNRRRLPHHVGSRGHPRLLCRHTWYRDSQAVPAGHCQWIEDGQVTHQRCWQDSGYAWRQADITPVPPAPEVRAHVRQARRETVARHRVTDVPVGVFLTGGSDAGTLAGLMVEAVARDLQSVTSTDDEFRGQNHDEAPVAAHWDIRHHVRWATRDEFLADIPRILADRSRPSTYLGWSTGQR